MKWQSAAINDVLLTHDSGVWGAEDVENGVSVLRSTNMQNDGTIDYSKLALRAIPHDKRVAKLLEPGDTLLENSGGGPKQPVGRVCYFHGDARDHVAGNFCRRLRANCDIVHPRFLFWNLFYLHATGETERFQTQTTGIRNLQFRLYAQRELLLPPPSEQRRIVEILDQADALRKLRRDADAKAARILPALFLKMFGDPQRNPFGLEKKPLGELIRVKSGRFLSAKNMTETGPFPVYGGNGVNGHHNEYMFEERKIVLGRVGAYCGAVHYTEPRSWITDNALYVTEKLKPLIDRYLVVALTQANLNQYAGRAGQPLISGTRIYPVEILRPSEDAQVEFARIAEAVIQLHSDLSDASAQLESLWKRLMQRAFSGQLTAKWREAHMQELLIEMQEQARVLNLSAPN